MKKAIVRQKKRVIEEELEGETDEGISNEVNEYKKKIKKAKMPKTVEEKAMKELQKLGQMSLNNPEAGYVRNYLDWLTDMPWSIASTNDVSMSRAQKDLNEDHYAIDKTKERILEFLTGIER